MAKQLRVLRILEYTYDNSERMTEDMARWQVGANCTEKHGQMTIKSATMLPESIEGGDI